jgi:hypothetical protein
MNNAQIDNTTTGSIFHEFNNSMNEIIEEINADNKAGQLQMLAEDGLRILQSINDLAGESRSDAYYINEKFQSMIRCVKSINQAQLKTDVILFVNSDDFIFIDNEKIKEYRRVTFAFDDINNPLFSLRAWLSSIAEQTSATAIIEESEKVFEHEERKDIIYMLNMRILANRAMSIGAAIGKIIATGPFGQFGNKIVTEVTEKEKMTLIGTLDAFICQLDQLGMSSNNVWETTMADALCYLSKNQCAELKNRFDEFSEKLLEEDTDFGKYNSIFIGLVKEIYQWTLAVKKNNFPLAIRKIARGIMDLITALDSEDALEQLVVPFRINECISKINKILMEMNMVSIEGVSDKGFFFKLKTLIKGDFLALVTALVTFGDNISAPCNDDDFESIVTNSIETLNSAISQWNDIVSAL